MEETREISALFHLIDDPDDEVLWYYTSDYTADESVMDSIEEMEEELGDILFSLVNVARWHKIDPELALLKANVKFKTRFQTMESLATKELREYNTDEFEELWQTAKKQLQKNGK